MCSMRPTGLVHELLVLRDVLWCGLVHAVVVPGCVVGVGVV